MTEKELRSTYASLSTDRLEQMLTEEGDQFTDTALDVIKDTLKERGVDPRDVLFAYNNRYSELEKEQLHLENLPMHERLDYMVQQQEEMEEIIEEQETQVLEQTDESDLLQRYEAVLLKISDTGDFGNRNDSHGFKPFQLLHEEVIKREVNIPVNLRSPEEYAVNRYTQKAKNKAMVALIFGLFLTIAALMGTFGSRMMYIFYGGIIGGAATTINGIGALLKIRHYKKTLRTVRKNQDL